MVALQHSSIAAWQRSSKFGSELIGLALSKSVQESYQAFSILFDAGSIMILKFNLAWPAAAAAEPRPSRIVGRPRLAIALGRSGPLAS